MPKTPAEKQAEYRKRKKLMAKGYVRLDLWALPETIKFMRHGLRNQTNLMKPRKEVAENATEIAKKLKESEDETIKDR